MACRSYAPAGLFKLNWLIKNLIERRAIEEKMVSYRMIIYKLTKQYLNAH